MRTIPVLDLQGGVVVHARRGVRERYAPLQSPLVAGHDPVTVSRALRRAAGTDTLYVADLDAIAGAPVDSATLRALAGAGVRVWADAGAVGATAARALADAGVARNVIGTESLADPAAPPDVGRCESTGLTTSQLPADVPAPRRPAARPTPAAPPRVLSVDLRDGRLLSPRPELAGRPATSAVELARELDVSELLVIDLARVGSGEGPPTEAVAALAATLPGVAVYAGGGVRDDADLRTLARAGAAGALVATALHEGRLTIG